jgi:hypothetical protein
MKLIQGWKSACHAMLALGVFLSRLEPKTMPLGAFDRKKMREKLI